jgi:predicted DNA-binding transcriptional regulator YafY
LKGILDHMSNPSARMLRLLSLLQTHRFWPGTELAGRLEVSPRTVRRDVDRLRDLGYPVDASRGATGGYQLQAGAALPPLLLDDEEAVAIAVGLRVAAGGVVSGIEESSVRALAKLVQVMPPRLRRRVDALRTYTVPAIFSGPRLDASALAVIAQACRDGERLRFGYTARDSEPAQRHVEPHRLVTLGRRWYLVAWDVERGDWRMFRVDRLRDAVTTGARFRQRDLPGGPDVDAAEFVRARLAQVPRRFQIEVVFRTGAATVEAAMGGAGTVTPIDATSCRFRMSVDELGWPAAVLGMVGADFEVVGPPELRDFVRQIGTRLLAST